MGILTGISKTETNEEIKSLAIKALNYALPSMNILLEKSEIRMFLLDLVVACALEKAAEIAVTALQCLVDFVKM